MRAKDIMTSPVITVHRDTDIEEVCNLMRDRRITGVPVVDEAGALMGIITQDDGAPVASPSP